MKQNELPRLIKLEERVKELADEAGLSLVPIEFDIVPENKMLEIMAYGMPGQISNWKFGRDYERLRTIFDHTEGSLPLEVVNTTNPARAYLMKNNSFTIQALVMTHVYGHVAFSTMNQYHAELDKDLVSKMIAASKRFNDYERKYGIDIVEQTVDAGHSIYYHSSPFESEETEEEKRERIFEQTKQKAHIRKATEYDDLMTVETEMQKQASIERDLFNHKLWMTLKNRIPVEPTEDMLRFIIDNSRVLSEWQKDILELLRKQGRYIHPHIKTKYMNEGFATWWHETTMRKLFQEELLTSEEHAEFNYMNAFVKAKNKFSMNPYLIGCTMWYDLIDRYDKGQFGDEYEEEPDMEVKKNWDTGAMLGHEKMLETLRTHNDWSFMMNVLTTDLVRELEMYIYVLKKDYHSAKIVITDKQAEEIRELIVKSFAHSGIPRILVNEGKRELHLEHRHAGMDLDAEYTQKTLDHIAYLWGDDVDLSTKVGKEKANKVYKAINPYLNREVATAFHGDPT